MEHTTETHLRANVDAIAREIDTGDLSEVYCEEGEEPTVADWIGEKLDVEYVVTSNGTYLGARILCCVGGPTIWVDTRSMEVRGYWGSDSYTRRFSDGMGLDDALDEYWTVSR